jgi:hypothetical protein
MKVLAMRWIEAQTEFYGKRGMALQGVMIIYQVFETNGEFKYHVRFYDCVLENSNKEDAFASISAVQAALIKFKQEFTHIDEAEIFTDGAGAYKGFLFCIYLGHLHKITGIRVLNQYVSVSGCGKSANDGRFAYAGAKSNGLCCTGKEIWMYSMRIHL